MAQLSLSMHQLMLYLPRCKQLLQVQVDRWHVKRQRSVVLAALLRVVLMESAW
jgi:hypothetical protein